MLSLPIFGLDVPAVLGARKTEAYRHRPAGTVAGTEDTGVEPLLIVHAGDMASPEQGSAVSVTGTVRDAFDPVDVESELGLELEDETYADWEGQRYIVADSVDTSIGATNAEEEEL